MSRTKALGFLVAVVGWLSPPVSAHAAHVDGSKPLVCAMTQIRECDSTGTCAPRTAEQVNLPVLLRLDVPRKVLATLDASRTAPIHAFERQDGRLIVYGGQNGRGWTAVIDEESGRMTATIADEQAGFVAFGACDVP